jgi:hypothetical protein
MNAYQVRVGLTKIKYLAFIALIYWGAEILTRLFTFWWGLPRHGDAADALNELNLKYKQLALVVMCAYYGGRRIGLRHPAFNDHYRNWLWTTPWTGDNNLPLPMGPVELTWFDGALLASAIMLAQFSAGLNPAYVVEAFGIP